MAFRIGEDFYISHASRVPFYVQIARYLRKKIVAGKILYGDRLLASRRLAKRLRVHFNTVLKAYRLLRSQGVVRMYERHRGWHEPFRTRWIEDAVRYKNEFEIKAALREALTLGTSFAELHAWLTAAHEQVLTQAREHPDEVVRAIFARFKKVSEP